MEGAAVLRARGNALYKEGRFEDARTMYAQAIDALSCVEGASDDADGRAQIAQLYSNRAQTFVQERNFALALQDAVRALEYDPENEKAQLRRLVALENLERFETAFQLVERILDTCDARTRHPALFEYAITARRRLRKNLQQDQVAAKQESHAVGRMFVDVAVNIGNEFGLFRRGSVGENEQIKLQCELRNNEDHGLKLVFSQASSAASASTLVAAGHTTPVDGVVSLNERGKALFQLAIVSTDSSANQPERRPNMSISLFVHADSAAKWNLLPIVSLPFSLVATSSTEKTKENELDGAASTALGIHCCRPVWLPTLNRELLLAESPGNLGIGGKLWDSCLVLTRYLSRHKHELEHKTVVELGSGLGLVGMFCALLGAKQVTLTDIDEVVPLLAYNIRLNFPQVQSSALTAVPHFWGTALDNLPVLNPDVLVLSDVVYDPEGYAPLVASLNALASSPATTIFMAHRSRNPMEHQFFELLAQTFDFELIDWAAEEDRVQLQAKAGAAAATGKDERVLQDVKIFRITRCV